MNAAGKQLTRNLAAQLDGMRRAIMACFDTPANRTFEAYMKRLRDASEPNGG